MGLGKNLKTAVGSWLLGADEKGLTISNTPTGMQIRNNNLTVTDNNQYLHVLNIASLEDAPRKILISSPFMQNSTVAACGASALATASPSPPSMWWSSTVMTTPVSFAAFLRVFWSIGFTL